MHDLLVIGNMLLIYINGIVVCVAIIIATVIYNRWR